MVEEVPKIKDFYIIFRYSNIQVSTCLEDTKKIPFGHGSTLAASYNSETVAWIGNFLCQFAPTFALQFNLLF